MCNSYYLNKIDMFTNCYIDTSAIMNFENLKKFNNKVQNFFLENNLKIKVPYTIIQELRNHIRSSNDTKSNLAESGLKIILDNEDLYEIETNSLNNIDKYRIADSELLTKLTENKIRFSQLLITNDRNLSFDAYNINNSLSVHGKKVFVCYIDKDGELQMYNNLNENIQKDSPEPIVINKTVAIKEQPSGFERIGIPALCTVGGVVGGYVINENKARISASMKRASRYIASLFKN